MKANPPTPTNLKRLPDPADPKVVLVDDQRSWHLAMSRYHCDRHGRVCVQWLHAYSAYHAIEILEEQAREIALVVSDHRMPSGRSGSDLLREVGERWPNVKRMMLTSWLDGDKASAPYETLSKDLDADYLLDRICKLARDLP